jgi:hypothetical protein
MPRRPARDAPPRSAASLQTTRLAAAVAPCRPVVTLSRLNRHARSCPLPQSWTRSSCPSCAANRRSFATGLSRRPSAEAYRSSDRPARDGRGSSNIERASETSMPPNLAFQLKRRRFRHPVLPAQIGRRCPRLVLPQHRNDLLFRKPADGATTGSLGKSIRQGSPNGRRLREAEKH